MDELNSLLQGGFGAIVAVPFDLVGTLVGFISATLLGSLIAIVYKMTNGKEADRDVTMQSFVLLSIAIAGSMMIVGNNLARAFGLVGAVSIIRFRTSVQNTRQMAFVFISIVVGMASGLGFYLLGTTFAVFSCLIILILARTGFGKNDSRARIYHLVVKWSSDHEIRPIAENALKEAGIDWRFHAFVLKPGSKILKFHVIVPFSVDAYAFTLNLRSAIPNEVSKLSVFLIPTRR